MVRRQRDRRLGTRVEFGRRAVIWARRAATAVASGHNDALIRPTVPELGTLLLLLNVGFIIRATRSGRFWPWAYVILFLPGSG